MFKRYFTLPAVLLAVFFQTTVLQAEEPETEDAKLPAVSLAELAERADLVALVQARDMDYLLRREIPVSGSAYLQVLIPYKVDAPVDIVDVYEKGLHRYECYFPNPTVYEEGRRYLLFVRRDPDDPERFRGLAEGCALEVLVAENNRYALRYPPNGIELSDDLSELARPMRFADSYAVFEDEELSPEERNGLQETGFISPYEVPESASDDAVRPNWQPEAEPAGRQWIYTHGVDLGEIRKLMGSENLTLDRHARRTPPSE